MTNANEPDLPKPVIDPPHKKTLVPTLPIWKRLLFALLPALVLFLVVEFALYKLDFVYQPRNRQMRFAFPDPKSIHEIYRPSATTLWELRPRFNFPNAEIEGVNPLGLRGRRPNPNACRTILVLGDSVVFGGETSIPHEMAIHLNDDPPAGIDCPIDVLNAGTPAFSSWQGRRWLETRGAEFSPDLLIVLFGWNDHWWAKGYPDAQQKSRSETALKIENLLLKLKIYQLLVYLFESVGQEKGRDVDFSSRRVEPKEYRANLEAIARWCRSRGCNTLFLTAPMARTGKTPSFMYELGFLKSGEALMPVHERYNNISRGLDDSGFAVLDLAPRLGRYPVDKVFNKPEADPIHPNSMGYRLMAGWIVEEIKEKGLLKIEN